MGIFRIIACRCFGVIEADIWAENGIGTSRVGSYDRYTWSYGAPINGSFQWITGVISFSGVMGPYLPLVGAYFVCDTCNFFSYFALR